MPISDLPDEQALMPYAASTFAAKRAVVVAPHADDEVFGCGAAIASLRRSGARVAVAVLTDGAGETQDPAERSRIGEARLAESRAALEMLGGAELSSFGFPDRALLQSEAALREALGRFLRAFAPDLLFVPAPSEVHPDHRAAARAALDLLARPAAPVEPLLAFYEVSQPIRPNFLLDATPHLAAKEAAMAAFPSQEAAHDYIRVVRGLMAYRSLTLGPRVTAAEAYFVTTVPELREMGVERLLRAVGPSEVWRPAGGTRRGAGGLHL